MIDQNGHFYTFVTFKNIYGVTGTFLDYQRVLAKIPDQWKILIRNNQIAYKVACSIYTSFLIRDKKGCRRFYDIMVKTDEVSIQNKWLREVGNLNESNFFNYNKVLLDLKEVALKDFQFKVNNKILVTKAFLHRIGKIDNNQCSYCNQNIETIYHLFIECDKVKQFWQELRQWLSTVSNLILILEEKSILFSYHVRQQLLNYILTVAKQYIYKTKFFADK